MRISENHWLLNKPIAHRGLWNESIPENSLSAYRNAAENGFAIEIDIYLTKDGHLVSFHDETLNRMTDEKGFIYDKTLAELKSLKLRDSNETIPTLDEVLEVCDGNAPLLIEFKNQPDKRFVKTAVERLKKYKGEFCVQSFNPFYLNKIKKLAPEFIRGILATDNAPEESALNRYVLKNMTLNFLIKPDFISYRYGGLPLPAKKVKNLPVITWTITDQNTANKVKPFADNIIFENFIPEK